ncbi:hypothetical protein RY831_15195 [Noviherbaspirillum sp. CPCC 100848]|uniref:DUF805 domain-containing protein n=1 Tax=Noviherbaspirillum album TaxID=3080276 RepID=A0ABU6JB68_9BURK|nr:hypothetical protein [Noviherbaspirillum sp. CPCC 100848]MEC4720507.1 hypothetical protein [Noviherbaspirillum sp. CPCC 100848]
MLRPYKKKANIAAGIWLASVGLLGYVGSRGQGNIWDNGDILSISSMVICMTAYWYAFWAYARAKGRSGAWGIILPIFSIIGLLTLAALRDLHPDDDASNGEENRDQ